MRSSLAPTLVLVLLGGAAVADAEARAQSVVTTTLLQGGEPLIFSGRVKWPEADRYFVLGKKDARLIARMTGTNPRLLLVLVPGDADPREPQKDWIYADKLDTRLLADGRYAIAVLFHPKVDFTVPPAPASYRLELSME